MASVLSIGNVHCLLTEVSGNNELTSRKACLGEALVCRVITALLHMVGWKLVEL